MFKFSIKKKYNIHPDFLNEFRDLINDIIYQSTDNEIETKITELLCVMCNTKVIRKYTYANVKIGCDGSTLSSEIYNELVYNYKNCYFKEYATSTDIFFDLF